MWKGKNKRVNKDIIDRRISATVTAITDELIGEDEVKEDAPTEHIWI